MSTPTLLFADQPGLVAGLIPAVPPWAAAEGVLAAAAEPEGPLPPAEDLCRSLDSLCRQHDPDLVLVAATPLGRELAPRLAVRLGTGCVSDCTRIDRNADGAIVAERPVYGGVALATVAFRTRPAICLVTPAARATDGAGNGGAVPVHATVTLAPSEPTPGAAKQVQERQTVSVGIDLTAAERIVAVGRGLARQADLALAEELARVLDAEVGCSRPLSEDLGWLPLERQVGLTGQTVRPQLYLALGISGQVQHMVGVKDARIIVAINSQGSAPIFKAADYGIVGDLYNVVPELIRAFQATRAARSG